MIQMFNANTGLFIFYLSCLIIILPGIFGLALYWIITGRIQQEEFDRLKYDIGMMMALKQVFDLKIKKQTRIFISHPAHIIVDLIVSIAIVWGAYLTYLPLILIGVFSGILHSGYLSGRYIHRQQLLEKYKSSLKESED